MAKHHYRRRSRRSRVPLQGWYPRASNLDDNYTLGAGKNTSKVELFRIGPNDKADLSWGNVDYRQPPDRAFTVRRVRGICDVRMTLSNAGTSPSALFEIYMMVVPEGLTTSALPINSLVRDGVPIFAGIDALAGNHSDEYTHGRYFQTFDSKSMRKCRRGEEVLFAGLLWSYNDSSAAATASLQGMTKLNVLLSDSAS